MENLFLFRGPTLRPLSTLAFCPRLIDKRFEPLNKFWKQLSNWFQNFKVEQHDTPISDVYNFGY